MKLLSAYTQIVNERHTQLYFITDDNGHAIQLQPCFLLSVVEDDGNIVKVSGPSLGAKNLAYGHALHIYMSQASFRHISLEIVPKAVLDQNKAKLMLDQIAGWEVAEVPADFLQKAHEDATRRSKVQPRPVLQIAPPVPRAPAKPKVQQPSVMRYMLTIGALVAIAIAF